MARVIFVRRSLGLCELGKKNHEKIKQPLTVIYNLDSALEFAFVVFVEFFYKFGLVVVNVIVHFFIKIIYYTLSENYIHYAKSEFILKFILIFFALLQG